LFTPTAATRIAKSSLAKQLTFFSIMTNQPTMTIKLISDTKTIEITIEEDSNIFELTNAFRALAFAQGYQIESINKAMLRDDY
jgi:hypothetical protein